MLVSELSKEVDVRVWDVCMSYMPKEWHREMCRLRMRATTVAREREISPYLFAAESGVCDGDRHRVLMSFVSMKTLDCFHRAYCVQGKVTL